MQKETDISLNSEKAEPNLNKELEITQPETESGYKDAPTLEFNEENTNQNPQEDLKESSNAADFEELIKGPYKDAFAKKVQGIINKRFKEQKTAESKTAEPKKADNNTASTQESQTKNADTDNTYNALISAGIDPETAYRVLHLDEIMDSSMRYGAELAAKQLAESIRQKAARPHESALSGKGFSAKTSVGSLTPQKRKELAKKALMGEQIGF